MVQLGDREAMDAFARINAGAMPIPEFFTPEHLGARGPRAAARG